MTTRSQCFNRKQWLWKNALDCASKEFHLARRDVDGDSPGWSFDSARMLIHFEAQLQPCFAYFNMRTKAFEQTPYLRMVNTKLHTEKPYDAFPNVASAGDDLASFVVFAGADRFAAIGGNSANRDFAALDQELQTRFAKSGWPISPRARRHSSVVEFWPLGDTASWNKAAQWSSDLLVRTGQPEKESRKLQFLCDLAPSER